MLSSPLSSMISVRRSSPYFRCTSLSSPTIVCISSCVAAEDGAQPLDRLQQLGHLVENLLALEAGQPLQLHVENRLRLNLAERELRDEAVARFRNGLRPADQLDDRVEMVERDLQPFEDVVARFGLAQLELRAADHDLAAEIDEAFDELGEVQHLRPARRRWPA